MKDKLTLSLRSYDDVVETHDHDFHQLVLPVQGSLQMTIGKQCGQAQQTQAGIIPAGSIHSFAATPNNQFMVMDVPYETAPQLERLPSFIDLDTALIHYLGFLQHELKRQTQPAMAVSLFVQLLQERFEKTIKLDQRVLAAKQYLEQHYDQAINLIQLAQVACLSVRQLSTLFKQQLNTTPQQYLTQLRLEQAQQLLKNTSLSIQQIADKVGYQSLSVFSQRFKQHYHCSPREYRQFH